MWGGYVGSALPGWVVAAGSQLGGCRGDMGGVSLGEIGVIRCRAAASVVGMLEAAADVKDSGIFTRFVF